MAPVTQSARDPRSTPLFQNLYNSTTSLHQMAHCNSPQTNPMIRLFSGYIPKRSGYTSASGGCDWLRSVAARNVSSQIRQQNATVQVKSCQTLRNGTFPEYIESGHSKLHNLIWRKAPENVYVCKKPWNESVTKALVEFIRHVNETYPAVNLIVSEDVCNELLLEDMEEHREGAHVESENSGPNGGSHASSQAPLTIYTGKLEDIVDKTDLIVSLGGDGTILRAVSAFLTFAQVPPVLSFALGTLGFLLPFDFSKMRDTFKMVYESRAKVLHRSRLECHVVRREEEREDASGYGMMEKVERLERVAASLPGGVAASKPGNWEAVWQGAGKALNEASEGSAAQSAALGSQNGTGTGADTTDASDSLPAKSDMMHAMNDISLHRGLQPNLISLDIYIDNNLLTTSTADGIIFSTPTGSTAYSLSAGGSITHPLVPCILLTPICPRSLSFRPLILPLTSHIMIQMSENNRNHSIKLNVDGIPQTDLRPGDQIHVISELGTIYVPGTERPVTTVLKRANKPDKKTGLLRGIWCVARSEVDWTKDINELLGFNSSFKQTSKRSDGTK